MKAPIARLKDILSELSKVTEKERAAITQRAFDVITELTSQKEALLADFDAAAAELGESELTGALLSELEIIRVQAAENAEILKAAAIGARNARARLQTLREADLKTGVYNADGKAMKNPNASTFAAKA